MDLGAFRRALGHTADQVESPLDCAALDYGMLTASLQAGQAASLTARLQATSPRFAMKTQVSRAAIVEVLVGGPDWKNAVEAQGGSFNVDYARRPGSNA